MSMCSTENLAKQDITTTDAVTNRLKKVLFLNIFVNFTINFYIW